MLVFVSCGKWALRQRGQPAARGRRLRHRVRGERPPREGRAVTFGAGCGRTQREAAPASGAAVMEFYLQAFTNHKEQALAAYRQGDVPAARQHLLQAARYLALAAQKSEGRLRASRLDASKKLLEMARSLKGRERRQARPPAWREASAAVGDIERLIVATDPGIRFKDIAGLEDVKEQIRLRLIYPFTHAEQAAKYGVKRGG